MNRTLVYISGCALLAVIAVMAWFLYQRSAQHPLPLASSDVINFWNFDGAYLDGGVLEAKAKEEIIHLKKLLHSDEFTDYEIYVSIANQYELLGDGKNSYIYLGKAIREDTSGNTGLAWHNAGVLLSRLGALDTARIAYEKATIVEQQIYQYHYAYLEFLIQKMNEDSVNIEKAFAAAKDVFGNTPDLDELRAEWEKS